MTVAEPTILASYARKRIEEGNALLGTIGAVQVSLWDGAGPAYGRLQAERLGNPVVTLRHGEYYPGQRVLARFDRPPKEHEIGSVAHMRFLGKTVPEDICLRDDLVEDANVALIGSLDQRMSNHILEAACPFYACRDFYDPGWEAFVLVGQAAGSSELEYTVVTRAFGVEPLATSQASKTHALRTYLVGDSVRTALLDKIRESEFLPIEMTPLPYPPPKLEQPLVNLPPKLC